MFNAANENNPLIADGAAGTTQVLNGTTIHVSPDVEVGYLLQSLSVKDANAWGRKESDTTERLN